MDEAKEKAFTAKAAKEITETKLKTIGTIFAKLVSFDKSLSVNFSINPIVFENLDSKASPTFAKISGIRPNCVLNLSPTKLAIFSELW